METIDLTPTPDEYRSTLMYIIQNVNSGNENYSWAKGELRRVENVVEWGPQPSIDTDSSVL
jgi:hypothetical protein